MEGNYQGEASRLVTRHLGVGEAWRGSADKKGRHWPRKPPEHEEPAQEQRWFQKEKPWAGDSQPSTMRWHQGTLGPRLRNPYRAGSDPRRGGPRGLTDRCHSRRQLQSRGQPVPPSVWESKDKGPQSPLHPRVSLTQHQSLGAARNVSTAVRTMLCPHHLEPEPGNLPR